MAQFARTTAIPLPLITGRSLSTAEWYATQHAAEQWTFSDALQVGAVERLDAIRFIVQSVFSEKTAKIQEPIHIPRPGEKKAELRKLTGPELAEMLRQEGVVRDGG